MKKLIILSVVALSFMAISCKKENPEPQEITTGQVETLSIGSWNMDAMQAVEVNLENPDGIISVDVIIYSDNGNETPLIQDGSYIKENGSIFLLRKENGYFDQSAFSNSTINRGIITIHYQ